jgi:hypothetical protein
VTEQLAQMGWQSKCSKNSREILVADTVVGFFLIQKQDSTVECVASSIVQNLAQAHGDIRSLASANKTGLIRVNDIRHEGSKTIG